MNAKAYSILALVALFVIGAVFVYANTGSSEEVDTLDGGGVVEPMGCNNYCSWCVPINGDGVCDIFGSCC